MKTTSTTTNGTTTNANQESDTVTMSRAMVQQVADTMWTVNLALESLAEEGNDCGETAAIAAVLERATAELIDLIGAAKAVTQ